MNPHGKWDDRHYFHNYDDYKIKDNQMHKMHE